MHTNIINLEANAHTLHTSVALAILLDRVLQCHDVVCEKGEKCLSTSFIIR